MARSDSSNYPACVLTSAVRLGHMLHWLFRIAMGQGSRKTARCSNCNAAWKKSIPFVEGPESIFLCKNCLNRFSGKHGFQLPVNANDPNPFVAPTLSARQCSFCQNQSNELRHFGTFASQAICETCISDSIEMVEGISNRSKLC